ncbi:hypothetical protein PybrP1_005822 [[Pythium] brassicae (nom. inval.)]|nr:hypothetical protein PybrP1_005822 [[Pythium] brassicae (nom. inval.)]
MMDDNSSEYEPILPTTTATRNSPSRQQSRLASRFRWRYGGFEYQKRVWETTARRSHRLRVVAVLQLALGFLASWNYLWLSNIFGAFVGAVGLKAVRSDRMSWTIVYLLVCAMEFARNLMLAPQIYARYCVPQVVFSSYEYFQVGVMALQVGVLIPAAFTIVFAATATLANPLW